MNHGSTHRPRADAEIESIDVDILRILATGANSRVVAARLGLPPRTVQRRLRELKRRLDARNNIHAVAIVVRRGLI